MGISYRYVIEKRDKYGYGAGKRKQKEGKKRTLKYNDWEWE